MDPSIDGRHPQTCRLGKLNPGRFTIRRQATRDLEQQATWLREEAGDEVASRYLTAADASFRATAQAPGVGGLADTTRAGLTGARKWRVEGYANHLIFYVPRLAGGVTILRVLHAAQDWKRR